MTRRAVTQAQLQRAVKAFEAMGKTVAGLRLRPDGSWDLRLTTDGDADLTSAEQAEAEWDKALGLQ